MAVYVIQKCAISLDGYLNDASGKRLLISNAADFDRADQVRAEVDAILVGAGTVRSDDPHLTVKSKKYRAIRRAKGRPSNPLKIILTNSGNLSPDKKVFADGTPKLVYCPNTKRVQLHKLLGPLAEVVASGKSRLNLVQIIADLNERGIKKLLIEAGSSIGAAFLEAGLVDELQISIAPFFIGDQKAPYFFGGKKILHGPRQPMKLIREEKLGDMILLTYCLKRSTL